MTSQNIKATKPRAQQVGWTLETARMIDRMTPDIKGKPFDPDWALLYNRLDEAGRIMDAIKKSSFVNEPAVETKPVVQVTQTNCYNPNTSKKGMTYERFAELWRKHVKAPIGNDIDNSRVLIQALIDCANGDHSAFDNASKKLELMEHIREAHEELREIKEVKCNVTVYSSYEDLINTIDQINKRL